MVDWRIDDAETTHRLLQARCAHALARLSAMERTAALRVLADPRPLHRAIYRDLTPTAHPEFAGNFRGGPYASLKESLVAFSFTPTEGTTDLAPPGDVEGLMRDYARLISVIGMKEPTSASDALSMYAPAMIVFGLIHPFKDGMDTYNACHSNILSREPGFG